MGFNPLFTRARYNTICNFSDLFIKKIFLKELQMSKYVRERLKQKQLKHKARYEKLKKIGKNVVVGLLAASYVMFAPGQVRKANAIGPAAMAGSIAASMYTVEQEEKRHAEERAAKAAAEQKAKIEQEEHNKKFHEESYEPENSSGNLDYTDSIMDRFKPQPRAYQKPVIVTKDKQKTVVKAVEKGSSSFTKVTVYNENNPQDVKDGFLHMEFERTYAKPFTVKFPLSGIKPEKGLTVVADCRELGHHGRFGESWKIYIYNQNNKDKIYLVDMTKYGDYYSNKGDMFIVNEGKTEFHWSAMLSAKGKAADVNTKNALKRGNNLFKSAAAQTSSAQQLHRSPKLGLNGPI